MANGVHGYMDPVIRLVVLEKDWPPEHVIILHLPVEENVMAQVLCYSAAMHLAPVVVK